MVLWCSIHFDLYYVKIRKTNVCIQSTERLWNAYKHTRTHTQTCGQFKQTKTLVIIVSSIVSNEPNQKWNIISSFMSNQFYFRLSTHRRSQSFVTHETIAKEKKTKGVYGVLNTVARKQRNSKIKTKKRRNSGRIYKSLEEWTGIMSTISTLT